MSDERTGEDLPPAGGIPQRAGEGMAVYDRDGQAVGIVDAVYYGGASEDALRRVLEPESTPPIGETENNWSIFDADGLPAEARAQLMRQGFLRVNGPGLSGPARYLRPEQIEGVFTRQVEDSLQDVVRLHVTRQQLLNT